MNCNLSLNYIKESWCSATRAMDRRTFCRAILPDCYDTVLCSGQGDHFLNTADSRSLTDQTLNGLMRGNRKSLQNLGFASVAFTKDFQSKLSLNASIAYRDPDRPQELAVDNMLKKIRLIIRTNCAPMAGTDLLFSNMDFSLLGQGSEEQDFHQVELAIHTLLARETETSLTYALFLMIVTAILQSRIGAVKHLYTPEALEKLLRIDEELPVLELEGATQVPFVDPNYMHDYHIYFYRDTPARELWSGTLTMKLNQNRALASLSLSSRVRSPITGEQDIQRIFTGVPMLSRQDHVVYIGMTDQLNSFALLTFSHTPFNFAPMYFRSGLLISAAPETKSPIAQRVAIVARELSEEELPYVWGLLKVPKDQILLTQKQYQLFLERFRDYPWMESFREYYMPLFEAHRRSMYCFNEEELLAWSIGDLPYEDRLRILLALRSVDSPSNSMLGKFLDSTPPTRTHAILK